MLIKVVLPRQFYENAFVFRSFNSLLSFHCAEKFAVLSQLSLCHFLVLHVFPPQSSECTSIFSNFYQSVEKLSNRKIEHRQFAA